MIQIDPELDPGVGAWVQFTFSAILRFLDTNVPSSTHLRTNLDYERSVVHAPRRARPFVVVSFSGSPRAASAQSRG